MTQLTPIRLDDGTVIFIEATENVSTPPVLAEEPAEGEEEALVDKGGRFVDVQEQMVQNFTAIEGTIRAYTIYTLNAFRKMAVAEVDKVTLEFGVNVGGMTGVPYIATGTAACNVKITVECSFSGKTERKT